MKSFSRKTALSLAAAWALGAASSASGQAWTIGNIDQQNPGPFTTTNGAPAPFSFGQSFTPTFAELSAFEFLLGGSATAFVNLRDGVFGPDGLGGTLLAQSLPTTIPVTGSEVYRFDFSNGVPLTPERTYVAELHISSGSLGVRHTQGDAYAAGQFLHQGFAPGTFANTDLVFAEGIASPIPEPSTWASFGLGALLLLGHALKKKPGRPKFS
jgi:hypothetical protein